MVGLCSTRKGWATRLRRQDAALIAASCALGLLCALSCTHAQGATCNLCLTAAAQGRTASNAVGKPECDKFAAAISALWPAGNPQFTCNTAAVSGTPAAPVLKLCTAAAQADAQAAYSGFQGSSTIASLLSDALYDATTDAGARRSYTLDLTCPTSTNSASKSVTGAAPKQPCRLCLTASATDVKARGPSGPSTKDQCNALAALVTGGWAQKLSLTLPEGFAFSCSSVTGTADAPVLQLCSDSLRPLAQQMVSAFQGATATDVPLLGDLFGKAVPDGGTMRTFRLEYTCPANSGSGFATATRSFDRSASGCIPFECDCATPETCNAVFGQPTRRVLGSGGARRSLASADPVDVGLVQCCYWGAYGCSSGNAGVPGAPGYCLKEASGPACDVCLTASTTGRTGSKAVKPTQAQCDALAKSATASWAKKLLPTAPELACSSFTGTADAELKLCNKIPASVETAQSLVGKFYEDGGSVDTLEGLMKTALGGALGNSRSYSLTYTCDNGATGTYVKSVGEPPADEGCKLCVLAAASGRKGGAVTPKLCSALATAVSSQWAAKMNGVAWPGAAVLACGADAVQGTASEPSLNMCVDKLAYEVANTLLDGFVADPSASVASLGALLGKALPDGGTSRTFTAQYTCPSGRWRSVQGGSSFEASQPVETCQASSCSACKTKDECLGALPAGILAINPGQSIGSAANPGGGADIQPSRGNPGDIGDLPFFTLINAANDGIVGLTLSGITDPNQPQDGPINFTTLGGNGGALLFGNPAQELAMGSIGIGTITGSAGFTVIGGNAMLQPVDGSTCCTWDEASGCSANEQAQCPADISGNGLLFATR